MLDALIILAHAVLVVLETIRFLNK